MKANNYLSVYMNDHLTLMVTAHELTKRMASSYKGSPLGDFVAELGTDLMGERAELRTLMENVGARASRLKQGGGWIAEKAGRLKLNGEFTGRSQLAPVIEVEGLSATIALRLMMWQALGGASSSDFRLRGTDYDFFIARAERRLEELNGFHLEAAENALGQ